LSGKIKEIDVSGVRIGGKNPFVLIAGPCVVETEEGLLSTAEKLKKISENAGVPLIFKSSFDKANRSSIESFRGPGIEKGLKALRRVKKELEIPVLSDVHQEEDIQKASEVLDIIQIPAFLCRQTDFILSAAATKKVINVKKGQFLAPWDVRNIIEKIESTGNKKIILTERGVSFGYNNLVADIRSLPIMRAFGYPVAFDVTHSLQLPGCLGKSSGGESEFIPYLARAAVAAGLDAVFMETHPEPEKALCDGPNMMKLEKLPPLLAQLKRIDAIAKEALS
jgi:2-dehydro-3-deoxyphosphooctonate aldolase (KDO 8-P synthase)